MNGFQSLERALEMVALFKTALSSLRAHYADLLKIVDAEHSAISRSDLGTIENLVAHKVSTSQAMETLIIEIRKIGAQVHSLLEKFSIPTGGCSTISEIVLSFEKIESQTSDSSLVKDAFVKVLSSTQVVYEEFVDLRRITEPKIEMNKYLTERLLKHHQQSYFFWQEIAEQSTATYGDDGVQRHKVIAPLLRVKA